MYRQGDILIKSIKQTDIPKRTKPVKEDNGRLVLAYGEATGHNHALEGGSATLSENRTGSRRYIHVDETTELVHEEHATIVLEPGDYEMLRQKEYTEPIRRQGRRISSGFSYVAD